VLARIGARERRSPVENAIVERGTARNAPARNDDISALSSRLGVQLPASYVAYLQVTDGSLHPGTDGLLLPVSRVDRLSVALPEQARTIAAGPASYDCDPAQTLAPRAVSGELRREALLHALAVSEVASGQFIALLSDESSRVSAVAFDFWDVPRLYADFFDLMLDEVERSLAALDSAIP